MPGIAEQHCCVGGGEVHPSASWSRLWEDQRLCDICFSYYVPVTLGNRQALKGRTACEKYRKITMLSGVRHIRMGPGYCVILGLDYCQYHFPGGANGKEFTY